MSGLEPLKRYAQWIIYRLAPNAKGKMDKLPCDWRSGEMIARGGGGAHDRSVWTTYENALNFARLADRGHGAGVGFVLSVDDPFWFLDIDGCLLPDGNWSPLALELNSLMDGAAVEVSQSGRGLHYIGSGKSPDHRCKNVPLGLEFYTQGRFIALTERGVRGDASLVMEPQVETLVARYFAPLSAGAGGALDDWTSEPCEDWKGPTDDDDLIRRACKQKAKVDPMAALRPGAANGGDVSVTFEDLWTANVAVLAAAFPADSPDKPFDGSSADMSLAMRLAFWTGRDCERMERLMRASGLSRDKYERRDYIETTIQKAAGAVTAVCQDKERNAPPTPVGDPIEVRSPDGTLRQLQATDDKNSLQNVEAHLAMAGRSVYYDAFADQVKLDGVPLNDRDELLARADIQEQFLIRFSKETFGDGLRAAAYRNAQHPLRAWLDEIEVTWDGHSRIDNFLPTYFGVDETPFAQAVGALFLIAAVRRARQPGAKFDEILILEGPQGLGKSSAVAALCPEEDWFSEAFDVSLKPKELIEVTQGKWIIEAPELSHLKKSEVEHVKSILSRRFDSARMAFDRNRTDQGRHWVPFGTANKVELSDPTGNRRFWPVLCRFADAAAIARDRYQLWAEAAVRERSGASIRLPEHLWAVAAVEQDKRVEVDPITEVLVPALAPFENGTLPTAALWECLRVPIDRRNSLGHKVHPVMARLGWERKRLGTGAGRYYAYVKGSGVPEIHCDSPNGWKLTGSAPDMRVVGN